ncbi:MAG: hypothetical protein R6W82_10505 [bacterium]
MMLDRLPARHAPRKYHPISSIVAVLLALAPLLLAACSRPAIPEHHHYSLKLGLDPAGQHLSVDGELLFLVPNEGMEEAVFFLHRQLDVERIEGDQVLAWGEDRETEVPRLGMPDARWLKVQFEEPLLEGQAVRLEFSYQGELTEWNPLSPNVLTGDWIELGLYLPWFPLNDGYGDFTWDLQVLCEEGWEVRSAGDWQRSEHGEGIDSWQFAWEEPVNDIVVVASPDLKSASRSEGEIGVDIHYATLTDSTAALMASDMLIALDAFSGWLQEDPPGRLAIVESPRERGGGYARRGIIVLGGMEDAAYRGNREGYYRYLAHESAHLWWYRAPHHSWEDWLNEGFAEYFALRAIRDRFGEGAFQRRLEEKRESAQAAPPIRGLDRLDRSTPAKARGIQAALYDLAPLLLHQLEEEIGTERFLAVCRDMLEEEAGLTASFLGILETRAGQHIAAVFEAKLASPDPLAISW